MPRHLNGKSVRILVLVTVAALMTTACSDSRKHAASNRLREATADARRLYDQAQSLLSNPDISDASQSGQGLPGEALDLLTQAQSTVEQAIQQTQSAEPTEMDQALARQMLTLIRHLRGQYYLWSLMRSEGEIHRHVQGGYGILREMAQTHAILMARSMPQVDTEALQTMVNSATAQKAQAEKELTEVDSQIADLQKTIDEQEKTIREKNTQALSLRSGGMELQPEQRLERLNQALAMEKQAHEAQWRARELRLKLQRLQTQKQQLELQIAEADQKIASAAEIKNQRQATVQQLQNQTTEARAKLNSQAGRLESLVNDLNRITATAIDQSGKGEDAFTEAVRSAKEAYRLISPDRKAQPLSEQADAASGIGEIHMTLWNIRQRLEGLNEAVSTRWEMFGELAVNRPDMGGIEAFMDKTASSAEIAARNFGEAADVLQQASDAASSSRRWQFQRAMAWAYLKQAAALRAYGKTGEANAARANAGNLLSEVARGAEAAGKPRAADQLKAALASGG